MSLFRGIRRPATLGRAALMAAVAVGALQPVAGHAAGSGSFTRHTFAATATSPARDYWVYQPANLPAGPRPLVVFLHGCNESALDAAAATHFNQLADQKGFVVAYPQQLVNQQSSAPIGDGNGVGCWNWYLPADQQRDSGEPAAIAGITREVIASDDIDPARVYVEGISAGGVMSVIMAATYPDVYAASASLAGCGYATCSDPTGSATHQAMGSHARVVPMFVEVGSADTVAPPALSEELKQSWLGADDLGDDGQANRSIAPTPATNMTYGTGQTPRPGSGDACIHNNSVTCPGGVIGFQGGYPYTVSTYDDATGNDILEFWLIHGMQHAHPDAPGDGPYTDPLGPDITAASYDFFAAHPMPAGAAS